MWLPVAASGKSLPVDGKPYRERIHRMKDHHSPTAADSPSEAHPWVTMPAPAKLNLVLHVLDRLPSGFHELESIIAPLTLADTVSVRWSGAVDGAIECNTDLAPRLAAHVQYCTSSAPETEQIVGELSTGKNLAARAAEALLAAAGESGRGVEIRIAKEIPFGAGLGGGSADAAAALLALNKLLKRPLPLVELQALAAPLGSDIPALLFQGPVYVWGRGEHVVPIAPRSESAPLQTLLAAHLVVVKPPQPMPTARAYSLLARGMATHASESAPEEPRGRALLARFEATFSRPPFDGQFWGNQLTLLPQAGISLGPNSGRWDGAFELLHNDFQTVVEQQREIEVASVIKALRELGAERVLLAGSGSSCVGFFRTADDAERVVRAVTGEGDIAVEVSPLGSIRERIFAARCAFLCTSLPGLAGC